MKQLKVGLQLYSIREDMEKDMDATLSKVKAMGYDYVEFAGYYGKSANEVIDLLNKHDLECISVHQKYDVFLTNEKENIDFLKIIGAKYCAVPWMDVLDHAGTDRFDQTKSDLIKVGKALKEAGIQLLYHNHEFEFKTHEGKFLLDWLYDSIPSDLLETEIDTCWVKYAGLDPAGYIKKYKGRSPIVHLKDFVCKTLNSGSVYGLINESGEETEILDREDNGFEFRPLGEGIQDFASIIDAAMEAGTDYIIVEQDESLTCEPLEAARIGREYLKTLGL